MLVDSHCHLNFKDFAEDLPQVIARAKEAGIAIMQTICTEMAEFEEVHAIADSTPDIYCSVGVHPNHVANEPLVSLETLLQAAKRPKVIGIGETGLDYYYEHSPKALQQESFHVHIQAAQETGLPLIVHTRDADDDTVEILAEAMRKKPFKGLIHCFSSSRYLAEKCIETGLYISLSGILTFNKAQELRDTVSALPLDRLLVETDAPYLAPHPHRGKRNEPSFVRLTNRMLAEVKQISEEETARITTKNFLTLFSKVTPPAKIDSPTA
jgi:TatD DNase family protein